MKVRRHPGIPDLFQLSYKNSMRMKQVFDKLKNKELSDICNDRKVSNRICHRSCLSKAQSLQENEEVFNHAQAMGCQSYNDLEGLLYKTYDDNYDDYLLNRYGLSITSVFSLKQDPVTMSYHDVKTIDDTKREYIINKIVRGDKNECE